jgi:hypothetical protein
MDPKLINPNAKQNRLDETNLRQSHFTIGYPHQSPLNQYETTYDTNMIYKGNPRKSGENGKYVFVKPNVKVVGDGPGDYKTENQTRCLIFLLLFSHENYLILHILF